MERDQLNDAVRKVEELSDKLKGLAKKIEDKKKSKKLDPWMDKNHKAVDNNISKYANNVQNIVCSDTTSKMDFLSKSVKKCYILKPNDNSKSDADKIDLERLKSLLIEFEANHSKIKKSIWDFEEKYPEGFKDNSKSEISILENVKSTESNKPWPTNRSQKYESDDSDQGERTNAAIDANAKEIEVRMENDSDDNSSRSNHNEQCID